MKRRLLAAACIGIATLQGCQGGIDLSALPTGFDTGCVGADRGTAWTREEVAVTAAPADAGVRTVAGRYVALGEAVRWAERGAVSVDVGCCVERAEGIVYALQAAQGLPRETPVLIGGDDLRLAASLVNRLGDAGLSRAYLVVP